MTNGMELYYQRIKKEDFKAPKEVQDKCEHMWVEDGDYHGAECHRCKKCGKYSIGRF